MPSYTAGVDLRHASEKYGYGKSTQKNFIFWGSTNVFNNASLFSSFQFNTDQEL